MVKEKMVRQAKMLGGTAIHHFRYGQRAHKWWEKVFTFKWDTESWIGEGEACRLVAKRTGRGSVRGRGVRTTPEGH
jgi:hypothetical protein